MRALVLITLLSVNFLWADVSQVENSALPIVREGGIGAVISIDNFGVRISGVIENSPSESAGLLMGDYILSIDGMETFEWDLAQAVNAIRGEVGTTVALSILRDDVEITITMVRQAIDWLP